VRNARPTRLGRFAARFTRTEEGAVAVEFSLVIVLFVTMVLALFELAMVMLVYSSLETATQVAARQIRTGEFQTGASNSRVDFKNLVCGNMGWLTTQCASNAYVEVRTFASFKSLANNPPQAATKFKPETTCFTAGGPTDIVLVRTYLKWRLFTPFLDGAMENMGTGSGLRLMSSATAFRNEPYNESPPVGEKC
jgi:Flp pilus assembly protein TadG